MQVDQIACKSPGEKSFQHQNGDYNSLMESENTVHTKEPALASYTPDYKWKIKWSYVFMFGYLHLAGLYGLYLLPKVMLWTLLWNFCAGIATVLGVTAGAHRLWSHGSYKAKWPMKVLLMIFQSMAFQFNIYKWVRDHRLHHKFTDTDADPYCSIRGYFFSHMGWLLVYEHPSVSAKARTMDFSDLKSDSVVVFQRKWRDYILPLSCFILPTLVPWWFWNESLSYSWHINAFRFCYVLNILLMVNSIGHRWGTRPYKKSITPADNTTVSLVVFGEGWHNYHHVFPWDYSSTELGNYRLNFTTIFINFFAYLGLAYDLKTVPADMIKRRVLQNKD